MCWAGGARPAAFGRAAAARCESGGHACARPPRACLPRDAPHPFNHAPTPLSSPALVSLPPGLPSLLAPQALFCQVPTKHVLNMHDVSNIWKVPLVMEAQGAHESICAQLNLPGADRMNLSHWKSTLADRWDNLESSLTIAMVGKYTGLSDAYLSVIKALQHACLAVNRRLDLAWVDAEKLEDAAKADEPDAWAAAHATLAAAHGVLVPGGFGSRGVEGKILAAKYAREAGKPYLGICLGMQLAVVEFARNVLGLADANSAEFDAATPHPAVVFMPEGSTTHKGGTMRLGARRTVLETVDCISAKLYQAEQYVNERHRHRYEVNPTLVPDLEAKGLKFVGKDETGQRMEIVELQVRSGGWERGEEERRASARLPSLSRSRTDTHSHTHTHTHTRLPSLLLCACVHIRAIPTLSPPSSTRSSSPGPTSRPPCF